MFVEHFGFHWLFLENCRSIQNAFLSIRIWMRVKWSRSNTIRITKTARLTSVAWRYTRTVPTLHRICWCTARVSFKLEIWIYCSETGFLNGDCGRKPQVNPRSRAQCSNSIGRGVQPDQWQALDLSLTWGLLPYVPFKEFTSGQFCTVRILNFPIQHFQYYLDPIINSWAHLV